MTERWSDEELDLGLRGLFSQVRQPVAPPTLHMYPRRVVAGLGRRGFGGALPARARGFITVVATLAIALAVVSAALMIKPGAQTGSSASPSVSAGAAVPLSPMPTYTPVPSTTSASTPTITSLAPGFHAAASMTTVQPVAALLAGGQVLLVDSDGPVMTMGPWSELYDPITGQFKKTGRLPTVRGSETVTPLLDGRALVAGGWDGDGNDLAEADLFDPATGEFTQTGSLGASRGRHTATRLLDGRVLVAGGRSAHGNLASAELYDPATGKFIPTGSMNAPREYHTATLLFDGRVLVFGGCGDDLCAYDSVALATAEIYDPATGKFTPTGSAMVGRCGHTATLLEDGRVLITGGSTHPEGMSSGKLLSTAEIYDPKTGKFNAAGSMNMVRVEHTATLLSDGRVLIVGGRSGAFESANAVASAEIFDPRTGTFTPAGSMVYARAGHTATRLAGGRVLIAGGFSAASSIPISPGKGAWGSVPTAELYQP